MTIVRPPRRTTVDPACCFNDLSELLTFIALPPSRRWRNGRQNAVIPSLNHPESRAACGDPEPVRVCCWGAAVFGGLVGAVGRAAWPVGLAVTSM